MWKNDKLVEVRATDINPYNNKGRRWEVYHTMARNTEQAINKVKKIRLGETWTFSAELVMDDVVLIDGWEE